MVVKVTDKDISTKVRGNGEITSMPYGMVVWSTGIGPHPIIKDFMKQVGQVCNPRFFSTLKLCISCFQIMSLSTAFIYHLTNIALVSTE